MGRGIKNLITNADLIAKKDSLIEQQRQTIEEFKASKKKLEKQIEAYKNKLKKVEDFVDSVPIRLGTIQDKLASLNKELKLIRVYIPEKGPKVVAEKLEEKKDESKRKDTSGK